MCFHNFSLVLERGRPAAKRVLVGSDKFPVIQQAKAIGYETNILERVHKAKETTPRRKQLPVVVRTPAFPAVLKRTRYHVRRSGSSRLLTKFYTSRSLKVLLMQTNLQPLCLRQVMLPRPNTLAALCEWSSERWRKGGWLSLLALSSTPAVPIQGRSSGRSGGRCSNGYSWMTTWNSLWMLMNDCQS